MFIYCLPVTDSPWQDTESSLLPFVSAKRRDKILSYRCSIDKKLSLYAALLVRMQLSKLTGMPNGSLLFQHTADGKPMFLSDPQYHFSLSHTRNMILCGISNEGPLGIDTEALDKTLPINDMYPALHPAERDYIDHTAIPDRHLRFYQIWTQKEAYVKFSGSGFSTEPSDINTLEPGLAAHLHTWKYLNYMCSVFTHAAANGDSMQLIRESDIRHFFETPANFL